MGYAAASCTRRRSLLALASLAAFLTVVQLVPAAAAQTSRRDPRTPANLRVTAIAASSISIAWDAVRNMYGGSPVAGYGLYRDRVLVATTTSGLTTYSFSGLPCGGTYTLGVDAYDAAGNRSAIATTTASTSACPDTIAPTTPTGLVETGATATSVSSSWSPSFDNVGVAGYDLYTSGSKVATLTTTSYTLTGLNCGTTYSVGVVAFDAAGNRSAQASLSAKTSACSSSLPPTPTWVWNGNYDTGNFGQWPDGVLLNGTATASITSSPAIGTYAAKFQAGPNASDPNGYSRAEVQDSYPSQDGGTYGTTSTYKFAEYIPSSTVFAPHATFNHIIQWHPNISCYGDSVTVNGLKSPQTLVIRWRGGAVTNSSGGCSFQTDRTWDLGAIPRDRWIQFEVQVFWSADPTLGFLEVWMDGADVIPKTYMQTATLNVDTKIRQGLYRFRCDCTTVVYGDGMTVGH